MRDVASMPSDPATLLRRTVATVAALTWLVDVDSADLNGNGDDNAGWTDGDQINETTRVVVNRGTAGGIFTQPAALGAGWHYVEDDGDGNPALVNATDAAACRLTSSLAAAAFASLGPNGGPFCAQAVFRPAVSALYSDGTIATTQRSDGAGVQGHGFNFSLPWDAGAPYGLFGQRGAAGAANDGATAGFFDPPDGIQASTSRYHAAFENAGVDLGAMNVFSNGVAGSHPGFQTATPAAFTEGAAPAGTMTIGGADTSTAHPLRGAIRYVRCAAAVGRVDADYAAAVAAGLV